jgi:hypothetical protein
MAAKKKAAKKAGTKTAKKGAAMAGAQAGPGVARLGIGANGGKLTKTRIAAAVNALTPSDIQKVEDSKDLYLADKGKRP